jgi:hypothetical protein
MIFQALAKQYADTGRRKTAIWAAMHRGVESVLKIVTYGFLSALPKKPRL